MNLSIVPTAESHFEGLRKAVDTVAREKRYLARIELTVCLDNAKALYERFGFKLEGVNRNDLLVDGRFYDTYSMALIR